MGQSSSEPKKEKEPYDDVNIDSSINDKELRATYLMMKENKRRKMENLEKKWDAADNTAFEYAYERVELPLDEEGYCKSFSVDEADEYKAFFEKYGVVVVHGVLSEKECTKTEDEVWEFVGRMSSGKIDRNKPETWEKWISLSKLGILGNDSILSKQCCENRQNTLIYGVFCNLLDSKTLMVAVGRASMMRPTKGVKFSDGSVQDRPKWKTIADWLHWDMNMFNGWTTTFGWTERDQGANRGYDRVKVQGWVSVADCGPKDGGFHCVPGFAPHIRGWANKNRDRFDPANFESTIQVPTGDAIRKDIQKVPVRKGSLVVWNSKTPHGTFPNDSSHGRVIQYIKMADRADKSIGPLFTEKHLLPKDFELTPLGEKLYGFSKW